MTLGECETFADAHDDVAGLLSELAGFVRRKNANADADGDTDADTDTDTDGDADA